MTLLDCLDTLTTQRLRLRRVTFKPGAPAPVKSILKKVRAYGRATDRFSITCTEPLSGGGAKRVSFIYGPDLRWK